jgi:hypothetical protein
MERQKAASTARLQSALSFSTLLVLLPNIRIWPHFKIAHETGISKATVRTATASYVVHYGMRGHAKRGGQNWYGLANSLLGHAQQILQHSVANYCICKDTICI